jgi:NAD(P)-dependent dehydrogenase (short-subunit alcohol dehydrogenase family)
MAGRLTNRTALITNLPAAVLAAASARCLAEGARVVVASPEPVADLPAEAQHIAHDPLSPAAWQALSARLAGDFGGLQILIQGLTAHHSAPIADTTLAQFRAMNEQNLEAPFLAAQAAFRTMPATGGGTVVNITSAFGLLGTPNAAGLSAGAGGLRMLTKAAGVEGAAMDAKIRVNCIVAGDVEGLPAPDVMRPAPIPGRISLEELLDAVVFLASDDSGYMAGAMLHLDGGLTAS